MTAQQRIVRVRRNYNQWVANQTLEDYALRFTAKTARRWSSLLPCGNAYELALPRGPESKLRRKPPPREPRRAKISPNGV